MIFLLFWLQTGPPTANVGWVISRGETTVSLEQGTPLEIINLHGTIRVRSKAGKELKLFWVEQHHETDKTLFTLDKKREGATFQLEILDPLPEQRLQENPKWHGRRLDLTIFVPPECPLQVVTDKDLIEVKGSFSAGLGVVSEKGSNYLVVPGPVTVNNRFGEVFLRLTGYHWRESSVNSVNGNIQLLLPDAFTGKIEVETESEITSDYSIQIMRTPPHLLKRGEILLGEGACQIKLKSVNGWIKILSDD